MAPAARTASMPANSQVIGTIGLAVPQTALLYEEQGLYWASRKSPKSVPCRPLAGPFTSRQACGLGILPSKSEPMGNSSLFDH